jgi:hypothetical protein
MLRDRDNCSYDCSRYLLHATLHFEKCTHEFQGLFPFNVCLSLLDEGASGWLATFHTGTGHYSQHNEIICVQCSDPLQ